MFGSSFYKKMIALFALLVFFHYALQDTATSAHVTHQDVHATVIFDMSGVLVQTDKSSTIKQIGLKYFINYLFTFNSPRKAQKILFSFLDTLKPRDQNTPEAKHGNCLLPQLMCDWLTGNCSSHDLLRIVHKGIENNIYPFKNKAEKKLIQAIAEFMFTPTKFVESIVPIKKGVALAQACASKRDAHGHKMCRLIIVSNWDRESFTLLEQKPKLLELFALFDDIIISGVEHKIKPDKTIFTDLFAKYCINPDEHLCIFIDDQQENIDAFEQCGKKTKGILCKKFKAVHAELEHLLHIPKAIGHGKRDKQQYELAKT